MVFSDALPKAETEQNGENFERGLVEVRAGLNNASVYRARASRVFDVLQNATKAELVSEVRGLFPSLWTRAYLQTLPSFVLAVILNQE